MASRKTERRSLAAGLGVVAALALAGLVVAAGFWTARGPGDSGAGEAMLPGGAPDVAVRTVSWSGGETVRLSELLGRPVVLSFMAAWCVTCLPETQALDRLARELEGQVAVLVIDAEPGESEANLAWYRDLAGATGPLRWAIDGPGSPAVRAYGVRALDTTVVLDAQGRAVYRDAVPTTYEELRAAVLPLVAGE